MPTYLSSTYEDLKDYRRAVFEALRKSGYQVIAMEEYVATAIDDRLRNVFRMLRRPISTLAFWVSIRLCSTARTQQSKWLVNHGARTDMRNPANKPCLAFMVKEDAGMPLKFVDVYTGDGSNGKQIERLRKHLLTGTTFTNSSLPAQSCLVLFSRQSPN
ncbi:MAG: DUF4062 domain-containing protein [Nitrospirales bacterium]|nr:DUF4062 domain-containing protein [Nitrospirales bacterium]